MTGKGQAMKNMFVRHEEVNEIIETNTQVEFLNQWAICIQMLSWQAALLDTSRLPRLFRYVMNRWLNPRLQ